MKNKLTQLLLLAGSSLFLISSATAATFVWTGAGVDSNDLDAADNWTAAGVPASGIKLGTTDSADLITFDSETATAMPTGNLELVRIGSGNKLTNFELLNGSLNFDRAENWGWGGTFTIGDGDLTNSAVANFNATINLNRDGGSKTYVVNADGTLNIAQNFTWNNDSGKVTVVELNGGSFVSSGAVNTGLTNNASSVSFLSLDSSFTADFGGLFADLTDVTDQFGDSFTAANGSWTLNATDNLDGSFTVTAVPEPSAFALLAGCFGFAWVMVRRRA